MRAVRLSWGGVRYDAVVVGLGAMGAATLAELARRGRRVLGLEQFALPHARGSSQGGTRIIREAYFEHPLYVPLVQRAYAAWQALEAETGTRLLVPTGGLTIGPPDGRLVTGALDSARRHGLAHEVLTAAEVMRRHPARADPGRRRRRRRAARGRGARGARDRGVPRRGPAARRRAADRRGRRGVGGGGRTASASAPAARRSRRRGWCSRPGRGCQRWCRNWRRTCRSSATSSTGSRPKDAATPGPDRLPVLVIEDAPDHLLYALPSMRALGADLEDGVKFARHHSGVTGTADTIDRAPSADDVAAIQPDVRRYLPGVDPVPVRSAVCCYTNAADGHFIVDRHPAHDRVVVISACSGHGFKFAQRPRRDRR